MFIKKYGLRKVTSIGFSFDSVSILGFYLRIGISFYRMAARGFPFRDKITGGYPIIMKLYISDKKQITYILIQSGIAIPVHFDFFQSAYTHNQKKRHMKKCISSAAGIT